MTSGLVLSLGYLKPFPIDVESGPLVQPACPTAAGTPPSSVPWSASPRARAEAVLRVSRRRSRSPVRGPAIGAGVPFGRPTPTSRRGHAAPLDRGAVPPDRRQTPGWARAGLCVTRRRNPKSGLRGLGTRAFRQPRGPRAALPNSGSGPESGAPRRRRSGLTPTLATGRPRVPGSTEICRAPCRGGAAAGARQSWRRLARGRGRRRPWI
jgi:hypothetical protein